MWTRNCVQKNQIKYRIEDTKKYGQKMKELSVKLMYKIAQYMYT